MKKGFVEEALGLHEPRKSLEDDPEEPMSMDMVAIDPVDHDLTEVQPVTTKDTWGDYEYSRRVARDNLKQAQIILKAAVEFTNMAPSARAFEVLANLTKTVNDCSSQLLEIQKKMRDLREVEKPTPGEPGEIPAQNNIYMLGDPTDILKHIDDLRKVRDSAIEGQHEVKETTPDAKSSSQTSVG